MFTTVTDQNFTLEASYNLIMKFEVVLLPNNVWVLKLLQYEVQEIVATKQSIQQYLFLANQCKWLISLLRELAAVDFDSSHMNRQIKTCYSR